MRPVSQCCATIVRATKSDGWKGAVTLDLSADCWVPRTRWKTDVSCGRSKALARSAFVPLTCNPELRNTCPSPWAYNQVGGSFDRDIDSRNSQ